ncbi:PREDICTED: neuralized-like protein 4 [Branchiostoma belcheri]|uniref:Neuralized-like protein 4 n=1 Tax=Branchiostoma belcheri TaxID=7741 RepID=A0A6P4ZUI8_BRABE|nr:PREDICTED: neuralized-like protein 4 [Branchiostoma belcheri]
MEYVHGRSYYGRKGRAHTGTRPDASHTPGLVREVRPAKLNRYRCEYQRRCARFRDSLGLQDDMFFPERDMCYCPSCHADRGDIEIYQRGNPPKPYVLPLGWSRFALQVPLPQVKLPRGGTVAAFDSWQMCFHGTLRDNVKPILDTGGLRRPGDDISGGTLSQRNGHYNEEWKPEGFDTLQVFVSPSIRYSSKDAYSSPYTWRDSTTGQTYRVRSAFQARIRPGSYSVGPTTLHHVRRNDRIDPIYKNDEIEWSTKHVDAIMLYGLLIKMEPCT